MKKYNRTKTESSACHHAPNTSNQLRLIILKIGGDPIVLIRESDEVTNPKIYNSNKEPTSLG